MKVDVRVYTNDSFLRISNVVHLDEAAREVYRSFKKAGTPTAGLRLEYYSPGSGEVLGHRPAHTVGLWIKEEV